MNLRAWSGRPAVGSDLTVRFRRGDPDRAIDARLAMPWADMAFGLGLGLVVTFVWWGVWTGSRVGDLVVEGIRPRWRRRRGDR